MIFISWIIFAPWYADTGTIEKPETLVVEVVFLVKSFRVRPLAPWIVRLARTRSRHEIFFPIWWWVEIYSSTFGLRNQSLKWTSHCACILKWRTLHGFQPSTTYCSEHVALQRRHQGGNLWMGFTVRGFRGFHFRRAFPALSCCQRT